MGRYRWKMFDLNQMKQPLTSVCTTVYQATWKKDADGERLMAKAQITETSVSINPVSEFEKRIDGPMELQHELLEELQQTSRHWFDRAQAEVKMVSDLASKLTGAHSVPETVSAYQDWINRHVEMMADDGKHVLAGTQKIVQIGARLLSNSWAPNGSGGTT